MKKIIKHIITLILLFFSIIAFAQSTTQFTGILQQVGNPCTTNPCLPGLVWSLETDTADFILSVDNSWIWEDDLIINGTQYYEGDTIIVMGTDTIKYDIIGNPYYELEISEVINYFDNIQYNKLQIYPNPCNDYLTLESLKIMEKICLSNSTGQLIFEISQINDKEINFDIEWLNKGIYLIIIDFEGGYNHSYMIIKR